MAAAAAVLQALGVLLSQVGGIQTSHDGTLIWSDLLAAGRRPGYPLEIRVEGLEGPVPRA